MQDEQAIFQAAHLLKRGEVVAFPTETVYGLGALAFCEDAVKKIFSIKGRPSDNPLIAHVGALEDVESLAFDIPSAFYALADAFWPGPLTMVLHRRPEVPDIVSAGHPTIAVRMPSHPIALRLIREVKEPLVAPSANLSGRPSPTNAADVFEDLGAQVALILDGGTCLIGIESSVIDLTRPQFALLRPGAISKEEIEAVLGTPILGAGEQGPILSPGMKYRHYAPKANVRLILRSVDLPKEPCYLLSSEEMPFAVVFNRQSFYAHLRHADRLGVPEIAVYCGPSIQQDAGLMNRIFRSAGLYREQEGFVNLESARQRKIDPNERDHCNSVQGERGGSILQSCSESKFTKPDRAR
ncbi:MAG: threonylcarbamoyl-AMP synthase [Chlamydiae bacterium]|nr:threonylcarbamoyl-AMP synthase [Chlamydiota bacterium]